MKKYQDYPDLLLEEARSPKNQGKLPDPDLIAKSSLASCGDQVELYIKFEQKTKSLNFDSRTVASLTWESSGCIISTAGLSALSMAVVGQSIATIMKWNIKHLLDFAGLNQISPAREKCLCLGLNALQESLKTYLVSEDSL